MVYCYGKSRKLKYNNDCHNISCGSSTNIITHFAGPIQIDSGSDSILCFNNTDTENYKKITVSQNGVCRQSLEMSNEHLYYYAYNASGTQVNYKQLA